MTEVTLPPDDDALLTQAFPGARLSASTGLFDDDAPIRRWSRENAIVVGGGCALLLEVAHPLVAAGVARHSAFRRDPFGRLQRTLAAMSSIVFGSSAQAVAAARSVERAHAGVRGFLQAGEGQPTQPTQPTQLGEAGRPYSGRDPALMLWVWATLAWTTVRVHERVLGSVRADERASFHADQAGVARLLGIPEPIIPVSPDGFDRYFDRVRRTQLYVTPEAREIADALFGAAGAGARVPGFGLARALAASLLPAELRGPLGLAWSRSDEERLDRFARSTRGLRRS